MLLVFSSFGFGLRKVIYIVEYDPLIQTVNTDEQESFLALTGSLFVYQLLPCGSLP